MRCSRFRHLVSAFGLVAAVLGTGALAQQATPPTGEALTTPKATGDARVEVLLDSAVRAELGYWVGLQLDPASDALRSQLQLADDQGLVVMDLFPDTPAVKAGFEKHDLIVKVDDEPTNDVDAFNEIVQETKGEKELAVSLFRRGARQVIEVTPAKRPGERTFTNALALDPYSDTNGVLLGWPKGIDLENPMRVELYNPGFIVGRRAAVQFADLPKNLSISIGKSGDAPAKISVSKEHERWEVTDKELDKLPAEIREHVERMLRPGSNAATFLHMQVQPRIDLFRPGVAMPRPVPLVVETPADAVARATPVDPSASNVHKRLEEMSQQLDRLQKSLDALIEQHDKNDEAERQQ